MAVRHWLLSSTSLVLAVSAPAAFAADFGTPDDYSPDFSAPGPAVSAPNAKVGALGGVIDDEEAYGIFGAFALPVGHSFGLQIDGLVGEGQGDLFYGIAGHMFWRDPSVGLLGFFASYASWDASFEDPIEGSPEGFVDFVSGADVGKIGIEGEAYIGRVTLEGMIAYQFGTEEGVAGKGTLAFYPTDDLRFDVSVSHVEGAGFSAGLGAEWAPEALSGLALFADAAIDENENWRAFVGLTVYMGEQKSLIRRHREDDPDVELPEDLIQIIEATGCPTGMEFDDEFNVCEPI